MSLATTPSAAQYSTMSVADILPHIQRVCFLSAGGQMIIYKSSLWRTLKRRATQEEVDEIIRLARAGYPGLEVDMPKSLTTQN